MGIRIRKTFDFSKMRSATPILVSKMLNQIASLFGEDMKRGVARQVDTQNRPLRPLKIATIKAKRRKGSIMPEKALIDTNLMVGGIYTSRRATPKNMMAVVIVPKGRGAVRKGDRQQIGKYHNIGSRPMPERHFFYEPGGRDRKMPRLGKTFDILYKNTAEKIVRSAHVGSSN